MGWISHTPHWSLAVGSCTWFSQSPFHWFWVLTSSSASSSSFLGNYCGSVGEESACSAEDLRSISGLGRSPGEANGYPLQYSGLENPMDCKVHGVTESQTRLSDFHGICFHEAWRYWQALWDKRKRLNICQLLTSARGSVGSWIFVILWILLNTYESKILDENTGTQSSLHSDSWWIFSQVIYFNFRRHSLKTTYWLELIWFRESTKNYAKLTKSGIVCWCIWTQSHLK